jgi:hypothetical protein
MDLKYGRHQSKGPLLQQLIEGDKSMSETCSVQPCTLAFDDLIHWKPWFNEDVVPFPAEDKVRELGVWPEDHEYNNGSWGKFRVSPVGPEQSFKFKE